ncbi:saccharopine dehydrogenase NADP-binding domain-containing protein [Paenibacillus endoradicis]|uniref:saccharopine dehydrogenase NADP-binding domain-containing protein n=1 Tax=Paenibacillus endoradicis TaxID=2972487 RepID=UPI002158A459|nr:saccharopine dehydrogenase NADP-binding domain-containing protein [Paenibacillus endoradicis]MCR8657464.1 saccharopine dehydrogenase NADP-binding domain-containing protein [Paenibacillus endoradicis]
MKNKIIVVGGYGHVGQIICTELSRLHPGLVFAAGRSMERAQQFCSTTNGRVLPLQLDISSEVDISLWEDVQLVIMCLDQTDLTFVRSCLAKGIHYVDISAQHTFLLDVQTLQTTADQGGATAVISVGLAPGMTNLMAHHASQRLDHTDQIDISIMLGLGDHHGKVAIEWTVDNLASTFVTKKWDQNTLVSGFSADTTVVSSFSGRKKIDFGHSLGHKDAYRFNFSDQHTLTQTLHIPQVSTRLCFDSAFVTKLIGGLRKLNILRVLQYTPLRNMTVKMFEKMKFGSDRFAVKIDAFGKKNDKHMLVECFFDGRIEAEITAKVACSIAHSLYSRSFPTGVFHIEQLFDLETVSSSIEPSVNIVTKTSKIAF